MALASQLGITKEQLARLKLCEEPREKQFDEDVFQIARHIHVDPAKLVQVRRSRSICWFFRSPDDVRGNEAAPHRTLCRSVSTSGFSNKNQGLTYL
jgi:hypothetical protein